MKRPEVPYLSYTEIRRASDAFRGKYWNKKRMPLDIELIAERDLGITIDVRAGLNTQFGIRGFLNLGENKIFIDEFFFDRNEELSRFTIAHEIGHKVLHSGIYEKAKITTIDQYHKFSSSISEEEYKRFEDQANNFAGCLLVPTEILVSLYNKILEEKKMSILDLTRYFKVSQATLKIRIKKEFLYK